jgi:hypothetical protein
MVDWLQRNASDQGDRSGMWMVYLAVAVDLFSDGLMIGAGAAVTTSLALVLALGQVLADVPEGFAAIAEFKDKGVARAQRLVLGLSFTVPALLAAGLAYLLLRDQSEALQMAGVVVTAGLLTVAAVEDMMTEAHGRYAVAGVGEADAAARAVIDRGVDLGGQPPVQPVAVALQLHDVPRGREVRAVAGGVPGGARGQLVALEEDDIGPAQASLPHD